MKILAFLFFVSTVSAANDLILARGQSIKLPVNPNERLHITNKSIVNIKDQGRFLTITGVKLGYSSVVTPSKIFRIIVASVETAKSHEILKELIQEFKGLEVHASTDGSALRGELLRFSDWEDIAEQAKSESLKYFFESKMTEDIRAHAQKHFRKMFSKAELAPVRIVLEGGARAVLPTEFDSRRNQYKTLLEPFGIRVEKDSSSVALAPMVEVEIIVAEVQRGLMKKYGIAWPGEAKFSVAPQAGTLSFSNLEMALNALESKGGGRILASPKLLCRSGKEAEFLAGGEFPIAIKHRLVSEVIWKKHGVILKVKPLADLSGRMSIDIETEVSIVNTREKSEDLPNFKTNRIRSHFDLEGTRTVALSGLLKSVEANGRSGIPILSEIPIIGALFSSRDYLEERTELVFFVTPRLVPFDAPSADANLPNWNRDD
jgi:pilus assembly protein CpaC